MSAYRLRVCAAAILAALTGLTAAPTTTFAQACGEEAFDYSVSPGFVQGAGSNRALGLKADVEGCRSREGIQRRFPRSSYLASALHGEVPIPQMRVPQNIEASVGFGLSMGLSERNVLDLAADPDAPLHAFNYGFLGIGAKAQYESSADFDEQSITGGAELRYVDPLRPFLPSTVVTWEWVLPVESTARDALALSDDASGRLSVRGYWLIPIGERLQVELDAKYYWAFGLPAALEQAGWDEGPYASGSVGYDPEWAVGSLVVRSIFASYAWGEMPTNPARRGAVGAGVEIGAR